MGKSLSINSHTMQLIQVLTFSTVSREARLTPDEKNDFRALAHVTRSPAVRAARWHSPGAGSDVSSSICCSILRQHHSLPLAFQKSDNNNN